MSLHPAGTFPETKIVDHGYSIAKTGTHQFWVRFETAPEQTIIGYFFLSERAIENTIKKIRDMGYDGDDLEQLADGTRLAGCMVGITVDHESYQGHEQAKVGFVNRYGESREAKRDESVAVKVKMFNALLKAAPKGKPVRAVSASHYDEANPPPLNDQGYPF
jgi:methenyltetrahydromethanopterin cyclohydrolase